MTFAAKDSILRALQSQPGLIALLHDAGQVRRLAFSANGRRLAAAASKGVTRAWDVDDRSVLARLRTADGKAAVAIRLGTQGDSLTA